MTGLSLGQFLEIITGDGLPPGSRAKNQSVRAMSLVVIGARVSAASEAARYAHDDVAAGRVLIAGLSARGLIAELNPSDADPMPVTQARGPRGLILHRGR